MPDDAPVRAWRYWQTSPRRLLRSVSQRHVEWLPGRVMNAVCLGGGHRAPDDGCWCGVSGARDLDTLRQHGLCVLPGPLIVGEVDLWGDLIEERYGWRAAHARPASLGIVAETVPDAQELARLENALAPYEVPVTMVALDDAVGGTTAAMLSFQTMSGGASGYFGGRASG